MWATTLINKYLGNKNSIPGDIGNRALIQSNMIISKYGISMYVEIQEWSNETEKGFTSSLTEYLKSQIPGVEINFIYKPTKRFVDVESAQVKANIKLWKDSMDKKLTKTTERYARCLYTVDEIKEGAKTLDLQTVIEIRGKDYKDVYRGIKCVTMYLGSRGIKFKKVDSNLRRLIPFIKLASGFSKDEPTKTLHSTRTFAEVLPTVQGSNSERGVYIGQDILQETYYYLDLEGGRAKNIYILGETGSGKTVLAQLLCTMAATKGMKLSISDIKGNEFSGLINSLGGSVVSLRTTDNTFVDVWELDPLRNIESDYLVKMSLYRKTLLKYIINPDENEITACNAFISEYLNALNVKLGVTGNPTTWHKTKAINAEHLYNSFVEFLSESVREVYGNIALKAEVNFREFFSPRGSMSYLFEKKLDYTRVLESNYVSFDFGILKSASKAQEETARKIKQLYHEIINNDFIVQKNRESNDKIVIIEEESQLVDTEILKQYALNFTVRRAQNCINVLLGNSMRALLNTKESASIFDNINIILVGKVKSDTIEDVRTKFDVDERGCQFLEAIKNTRDDSTAYFYVRDMSEEAIDTIVCPRIPQSYFKTCRIFRKE